MNPGDWTRKLSRPVRTIGGPAFETLADVRAHIRALSSKEMHGTYWKRAAALLVPGSEGAELSDLEQQIRLALFYDGYTVTW